MFCILVISENNNNPGLFCTLPALISRFFKWTEIKFILSRDTQKHLTFYSKFIPVLLQNTVKKWEKYRYYSWPRMLGDWKWRPKMFSNSAILCYTFWAGVSLPYIEFTAQVYKVCQNVSRLPVWPPCWKQPKHQKLISRNTKETH